MNEPKLGELIDETAFRDAVHIAIAPVTSREWLAPGQRVGLVPGKVDAVSSSCDPIGIVDPFLAGDVEPGQRFWLCLYPRSTISLRHVWQHPAFKAKVPQ